MAPGDGKPLTVPKFSSFKPKTEEAVQPPSSTAGREDERRRHRSPTNSHHGHHRRHKHRSRHQDHPRSRSRENAVDPVPAAQDKQSVTDTDTLFFYDRRGDPLILRYGTNDRSAVPAYRRHGRGKVLGAHGFLDIDYEGNREKFSIRGHKNNGSLFRDKTAIAKYGRVKARTLKPASGAADPTSALTDDFIALGPAKKRRRAEAQDDDATSGEEQNYRSIEGKAKKHEFSDDELQYSSDESASAGGFIPDDIREKSTKLSREVKQHPENVKAWLELVALQESLLHGFGGSDSELNSERARGLADVKLALLESALPHAESPADREKILLQLMREGTKVWSADTLYKRWNTVTKENLGSFSLWTSHLDSVLHDLSKFQYEDMKQAHVARLRYLFTTLTSPPHPSEPSTVPIYDQFVYVFLRTTCYIRDAGFMELAVAAWQAMLEMTFARPSSSPEDDLDSAKSSFRDFWESEVPRMGEDGAKGWSHFAGTLEEADLPSSKPADAAETISTKDAYQAWASKEQRQKLISRRPAKTMDDDLGDDPFRVVMFSDLEELLYYLPTSTLDEIKPQLVDAFLLFCQLPAAFATSEVINMACRDPFINGGSGGFHESIMKAKPEESESDVRSERMPPKLALDYGQMSVTPELLFGGHQWFGCLTATSILGDNGRAVEQSWVADTLKHLARNSGVENIGEYYLALENVRNPSGVRKAAKALLKQYPANKRLYNAYALAECASGNVEVAAKVFSSSATQQKEDTILWNTWAWMDLEADEPLNAVSRIVSSIDGTTNAVPKDGIAGDILTPQILKTKQTLAANRDYLLSSGAVSESTTYVESLLLLEYLSNIALGDSDASLQGDIQAALLSVAQLSRELASRDLAGHKDHERLLQSAARLLYYHARHGPFQPKLFREQLLEYIKLFPSNAVFLSLFEWAAYTIRIDDPVRDVVRDIALSRENDSIGNRIFFIWHELRHGNAHSTRTAFEQALGSETCRGNAPLWQCYIRFCYSRKELKSKAKDVFYRGISSCPWSKDLIMEAFVTLSAEFDSAELRSVFNTMSNKGLRIHVDLEEFMQSWRRS